jgi:hypothetical protein
MHKNQSIHSTSNTSGGKGNTPTAHKPSHASHINGSTLSASLKLCAALWAILPCRAAIPALHCRAGRPDREEVDVEIDVDAGFVESEQVGQKELGKEIQPTQISIIPLLSLPVRQTHTLQRLPRLPPSPKLHTTPRFHLQTSFTNPMLANQPIRTVHKRQCTISLSKQEE